MTVDERLAKLEGIVEKGFEAVNEEPRAEASGHQIPFSVGCAIDKTAPSCGQASYGLSCKGRLPNLMDIVRGVQVSVTHPTAVALEHTVTQLQVMLDRTASVIRTCKRRDTRLQKRIALCVVVHFEFECPVAHVDTHKKPPMVVSKAVLCHRRNETNTKSALLLDTRRKTQASKKKLQQKYENAKKVWRAKACTVFGTGFWLLVSCLFG